VCHGRPKATRRRFEPSQGWRGEIERLAHMRVDPSTTNEAASTSQISAIKKLDGQLEPRTDFDILGLDLEAGLLRLLEEQYGEVLTFVLGLDGVVDERTRELDDG